MLKKRIPLYLFILFLPLLVYGQEAGVGDTYIEQIEKYISTSNIDSAKYLINKIEHSKGFKPHSLVSSKLNYYKGKMELGKGNYAEAALFYETAYNTEYEDLDCFKQQILYDILTTKYAHDATFDAIDYISNHSSLLALSSKCKAYYYISIGDYFRKSVDDNQLAEEYYLLAIDIAEHEEFQELLYKAYTGLRELKYASDDRVAEFEVCEKLLELAEALQDSAKITSTLYKLALSYTDFGMYGKATKVFFSLIPYYKSRNDFIKLAYLYNEIGSIEGANVLNNHSDAVDAYKKAIELMNKVETKIPNGNRAAPYVNLGHEYFMNERYNKAYDSYSRAYEIAVEEDAPFAPLILSSLGDVESLLGLYQKADQTFEDLLNNEKDLNLPVQSMLVAIYVDYASHLLRQGSNISKAGAYCKKAMDMAVENDYSDEVKGSCYECLYKFYMEIGDFEKATIEQQNFHEVQLKNMEAKNVETMKTVQLKNQIIENQEKNELRVKNIQAAADLKDQKLLNRLYIFAFIIILLSFSGIFLWINAKKNIEIKKITLEKNEHLKELNHVLENSNVELQAVNELISSQKQKIEAELKSKLLFILDRNSMIEKLEAELNEIDIDFALKRKLKKILNTNKGEDKWEKIEEEYLGTHQDFIEIISQRYPQITANNLKLCILIKLGLSNKEIAQLRYITTNSVKVARSRLRKKLGVETDVTLYTFLNTIGNTKS